MMTLGNWVALSLFYTLGDWSSETLNLPQASCERNSHHICFLNAIEWSSHGITSSGEGVRRHPRWWLFRSWNAHEGCQVRCWLSHFVAIELWQVLSTQFLRLLIRELLVSNICLWSDGAVVVESLSTCQFCLTEEAGSQIIRRDMGCNGGTC